MARAHDEYRSLRFGRRESERVIVALLLSVIMHFTFYAAYWAGEKQGWWAKFQLPVWLHLAPKKNALQAQIGHEKPPNIYVDVSHADDDAPTRTRYYSNKNSRAANPDEANANVPKLNGTQTDIPKTEDVPRLVRKTENVPPQAASKPDNTPQMAMLQPSMPLPSLSPDKPAEVPEPPQTPGETEQRKAQKDTLPAETPSQPQPQPQAERPRTLKQALAQRDQLPGPEMQQDGGVPRRAAWASLDVRSTPFGDYDRELIEAVQQRWDDLLDNHRYAQDRNGKVTLRFKLKPDGTVIEMQTLENTVGDVLGYLCQESIEEAAPFAKWPSDMVREIGTNYRDITFTFYYY